MHSHIKILASSAYLSLSHSLTLFTFTTLNMICFAKYNLLTHALFLHFYKSKRDMLSDSLTHSLAIDRSGILAPAGEAPSTRPLKAGGGAAVAVESAAADDAVEDDSEELRAMHARLQSL